MGILKKLFVLFILLFPIAEVGRMQFSNGVAISLNDIVLILVILSWLVVRYKKHNSRVKGFLEIPIAIFVLTSLASLLINIPSLSIDKVFISFLYLLRFVAYAFIYFIFNDLDKDFRKKISYLMLFSGTIILIGGYIQYFLYPSLRNLYYLGWDEHLYRMFSSFLDPNFAGAFFVIFFIFTLVFLKEFMKKKHLVKSGVVGIISAFSLIAVYLTYSRSAILMLILAVITYLLLTKNKRFIIGFLGILILLIFISPNSFKTEGTNFLRTASSEARIESVQIGIKIFQQNPIFGVGFNAYRYAQNRNGLNNVDWRVTHSGAGTDNSFLFIAATQGILGLLAYLYLLYKIMDLGRKSLGKNKYAVIIIPVILGLMLDSFFVNSLFYVLILQWMWLLISFTERN